MLVITNMDKTYRNGSQALQSISLTAKTGEFLTILGESGSGKTTLLRVVAGLEESTSVATMQLDGVSLIDTPAAKRNCTTVFQSYALFPHMNVLENVAYGLKVRRVERGLTERKAIEALRMVKLEQKLRFSVNQLSGGEKQRVALARALVVEPSLLLLDEPLGALDEKLRHHMQDELVQLHKRLGITFIYVTHSQQEALSMSDRIVLMSHGTIRQVGTPKDLFDMPNSRFAAEFMGYENLLPVEVIETSDGRVLAQSNGTTLYGSCGSASTVSKGTPSVLAIRAERIRLLPTSETSTDDANVLACSIEAKEYRGRYTDIVADTVCGPIQIRTFGETDDTGNTTYLHWSSRDAIVLTDELRIS